MSTVNRNLFSVAVAASWACQALAQAPNAAVAISVLDPAILTAHALKHGGAATRLHSLEKEVPQIIQTVNRPIIYDRAR